MEAILEMTLTLLRHRELRLIETRTLFWICKRNMEIDEAEQTSDIFSTHPLTLKAGQH